MLGHQVIVTDLAPQVFPVVTLQAGGASTGVVAFTAASRLMGYDASTVSIKVASAGVLGVATFQYSLDGTNYSAAFPTAATVALGDTGLTATFSAGNYVLNEIFTAEPRFETTLCKRGAALFWYQSRPRVLDDTDILTDTEIVALHQYYVCHLYGKLPGSTRPGVAKLRTK